MAIIKTSNNLDILIDEQDFDKASQYKWYVHKWGKGKLKILTYIGRKKKMYFSNTVFNIGVNKAIVHKNGNIFDYRRENIIICSKGEIAQFIPKSQMFTSKYFGVMKCKKDSKWWASPCSKKRIYGGRYDTEEEAGIVVDYLLLKHDLKYKNLNFPDLTYKQLDKKYKEIREKYGFLDDNRMSKNFQGKKRKLNFVKSSQFVGVSWSKRQCKWESYISFKRKRYNLGYYESEIEAARAYNKKAIELYGEKAKINIF
jgi:hypothetical protein